MVSFKKREELPFRKPSIEDFDAFIGNSMKIHGRIVATGSLRIDGEVIGNIESTSGAQLNIVVGRTGSIHGDIFAHSILIAGSVEGNINAEDKATLYDGSEVLGDISYTHIHIEHGAKMNGLLIARNGEVIMEPSDSAFSKSWEKITQSKLLQG